MTAEADRFERFLHRHGFHPVRLGGDNYSTKAPLQAVIDLMRGCDAAIILRVPQTDDLPIGLLRRFPSQLATPWNQIEGALAYALQKPTLVVAHTPVGAACSIMASLANSSLEPTSRTTVGSRRSNLAVSSLLESEGLTRHLRLSVNKFA